MMTSGKDVCIRPACAQEEDWRRRHRITE